MLNGACRRLDPPVIQPSTLTTIDHVPTCAHTYTDTINKKIFIFTEHTSIFLNALLYLKMMFEISPLFIAIFNTFQLKLKSVNDFGLSVCLSVRPHDNSRKYSLITTKLTHVNKCHPSMFPIENGICSC